MANKSKTRDDARRARPRNNQRAKGTAHKTSGLHGEPDGPAAVFPRLAAGPSSGRRPEDILALQQTVGNSAVLGLLAAKRHLVGTEAHASLQATVLQRKKLAGEQLEQAKRACLTNLASPDPYYITVQKRGLEFLVTKTLEGRKRGLDVDFDEEDVAEIVSYLTEYLTQSAKTDFDGVVDQLAERTDRQDYVDYLKSIEWPGGRKPGIVYGPATTTAFYDAAKHVITLDPEKLGNATQMLDSLTFECQNALQRKEMREALRKGGKATAGVEYESDKAYVEALMKINEAKDIDDLVGKLAIPGKYLKEADYEASKAARKVDRPDRSEFPDQDKRQALWWWKTKGWADEQRKEVWMLENHGEGLESSEELYEKEKQKTKTSTGD